MIYVTLFTFQLFFHSLLNGVEISDEGESKWGRRSLV